MCVCVCAGMSYTFTGLKPVTMYRVVVQLENGVSHKDDRVHLRRVEMDKLTNEGGQWWLYCIL